MAGVTQKDLDYYYKEAGRVEQLTGWDRDVVFAQWQLESSHFTSANFRLNNNLAGQTWTPAMGISKRGTARPSKEGGYYVKYSSPVDGYVDFIKKNDRYDGVPTFKTEEGQIDEIARSGWAVDPLYASKLKNVLSDNKKKGYHTEGRSQIHDAKRWIKGETKGLHPVFVDRLVDMARGLNKPIELESGFRSFNEQKVLYEKYKAGTGNLAAQAGHSAHNHGIAVDVKGWAKNTGEAVYLRYGLHKPVKSPQFEPWHIEPIETQGTRSKAKFEEAIKKLDKINKGINPSLGTKIVNTANKWATRNGTSEVGEIKDMGDGAYEVFKQIDELMSWDKPDLSDITRPFEFLAENGKAFGTRFITIFLGVILIIFGLVSLTRG